MRKLVLIAVMCLGSSSFAQENINMIKTLNIEQDIVSLENRITSLIKKNPAIADLQGLRQFHIFWLRFDYTNVDINDYTNVDINKEDFLNCTFLYRLGHGYYHLNSNSLFRKEKKYIRTNTLITDSVGNLVATGDARLITLLYKGSYFELPETKLAKMLFDKDLDFVFLLGFPFSMRYMVGIKDNNLYALEATKEDLKIYSWDEFMTCCFDEWVYRRKKPCSSEAEGK